MQISALIAELNPIEIPESDYLFIQDSGISNAGKGLFTAITIYKAEIIAKFEGEILNAEESALRKASGEDNYFMMLPDGKILDCMHTTCFAKYANDATGLGVTQFKNNAVILADETNAICLVAIRKIQAGEEIFCSYGARYWNKKNNIN
ncbi:MAG: SET domain-containing protein [Bacteroidetes bacterium]|nr:SET domain-containing protein [Bacteroidota bacterium]